MTVTDVTGCTNTRFISLVNPSFGINQTLTNATCGNNGAIDITVIIGGTAPFSYDWSNDGPEGPDNDPQDLTGLAAGSYNVSITDANGCVFTSSFFAISGPASLASGIAVTPIPCGSGGNVGSIDLSVTGGVAPYAYNWSDGNTTQDLNALPLGTY